ncbi:hypothetical protein [Streptomyces sp. NPDC050704]
MGAQPWKPRLHPENGAVLAEEVALLREEFLPGWRPVDPMSRPWSS